MIEYKVKVNANGTKCWCLNGGYHREDGPAIEFASDTKYWYVNGKCHREDGPAIEYANGTKQWYLNGQQYSEQEYLAKTRSAKELTVAEIEKLLGYFVKVIK